MSKSYGRPVFNFLGKCQDGFQRENHFITSLTAQENVSGSLETLARIWCGQTSSFQLNVFLRTQRAVLCLQPRKQGVYTAIPHTQ